jgi:hypothetical protein
MRQQEHHQDRHKRRRQDDSALVLASIEEACSALYGLPCVRQGQVRVDRVTDPTDLARAIGTLSDTRRWFDPKSCLRVLVATGDAAAVAMLPAPLCDAAALPHENVADAAMRSAWALPGAAFVAQTFGGEPLVLSRSWMAEASNRQIRGEVERWGRDLARLISQTRDAITHVKGELMGRSRDSDSDTSKSTGSSSSSDSDTSKSSSSSSDSDTSKSTVSSSSSDSDTLKSTVSSSSDNDTSKSTGSSSSSDSGVEESEEEEESDKTTEDSAR